MTQIKSDPRVHNRAKPVQEKPKEAKVAAKEAAPKRKAAKSKD